MNDTRNKIKYNEFKKFFQLETKKYVFVNLRNHTAGSVMSCTLATKMADLFVFN